MDLGNVELVAQYAISDIQKMKDLMVIAVAQMDQNPESFEGGMVQMWADTEAGEAVSVFVLTGYLPDVKEQT